MGMGVGVGLVGGGGVGGGLGGLGGAGAGEWLGGRWARGERWDELGMRGVVEVERTKEVPPGMAVSRNSTGSHVHMRTDTTIPSQSE